MRSVQRRGRRASVAVATAEEHRRGAAGELPARLAQQCCPPATPRGVAHGRRRRVAEPARSRKNFQDRRPRGQHNGAAAVQSFLPHVGLLAAALGSQPRRPAPRRCTFSFCTRPVVAATFFFCEAASVVRCCTLMGRRPTLALLGQVLQMLFVVQREPAALACVDDGAIVRAEGPWVICACSAEAGERGGAGGAKGRKKRHARTRRAAAGEGQTCGAAGLGPSACPSCARG